MVKKRLDPVHPGEILLEEFLLAMELSQNQQHGCAARYSSDASLWLRPTVSLGSPYHSVLTG